MPAVKAEEKREENMVSHVKDDVVFNLGSSTAIMAGAAEREQQREERERVTRGTE